MTTAIKLSQAQTTALYEIHAKTAQRLITARKNTVTSLLKAGLIEEGEWAGEPSYRLTDEGFRAIGEPVVDREANPLIQEHDSIEDVLDHLQTEEWFRINQATQGLLENEVQADTFDDSLPDAFKVSLGFAATLPWNNTEVWDGLTASQIRDDMDTAKHVSRKDRRKSARVINKIVKRGIIVR